MTGKQRTILILSSLSGFFGVALGAFGAHALKPILTPELFAIYETGNRYHLIHSVPPLILAITGYINNSRLVWFSSILFLIGILVFSGSLYTLAIVGIRALGAITPIGGIAFLIAWGLLSFYAILSKKTNV
ncbi:PF04241 family protein [Leptospira borgpetersenii serovar Pomona str. 200901868]|uniref:PF04241 family protein n=1 Tax=Leptospira borgpetersenii serovar Pomona str. 200901868 TaxID=1192866 RepID=M6WEL6_LEPBO|nr:PF04241 family protein [Leptospira borgpetersenii serovar Pomona str. 200901868]